MKSKEDSALNFQKKYCVFDEDSIIFNLNEYWNKKRFLFEIKKFVDFKDKKILDVGCGCATSVLNIIEGERHGLDPLMTKLNTIFDNDDDINWMQGHAENMPFRPKIFDIVICSNALDHFDDVHKAIKEITRVLKEDGILIITVDIFENKCKRDERHPYCFVEEDIKDILQDYLVLFSKTSELPAGFFSFLRSKHPCIKTQGCYLSESDYNFSEDIKGEMVIVAKKK